MTDSTSWLLDDLGIVAKRLGQRHLASEAWATIASRPGRALLTAAATSLSIGLLVFTIGLSATAERRVASDFDALRATQVLVRRATPASTSVDATALERLRALAGVVDAGAFVSSAPIDVSLPAGEADPMLVDLVEATPGALRAVEVNVSTGQPFGDAHSRQDLPVALVGRNVASMLGGLLIDGSSSIQIGNRAFVIIGIIDTTPRRPTLHDAVVIPIAGVEQRHTGVVDVVIRTTPGAAQQIAIQAPLALAPTDPARWSGSAPPDPATLRAGIEAGVRSSLLAAAAAVLLVAGLSIANAVYVSVVERTRELGVRRALGATSGQVRVQVLFEATLVGAIGGMTGASLGVIALVIAASLMETPAILPPLAPVMGVTVGTAVGMMAGWIPAHRAANVEPIEAIRME